MSIVNPTILEQQLLRLNPELKRRNMEYTHEKMDYSMYYHLPLSRINAETKFVSITVDIPLRPIGTTYKIYKMQPVPFRRTNKNADGAEICILDIEHHTLVHEQTDDTTSSIIVSNGQPSQCHWGKHLCRFGRYASTYRPDSLCVNRLLHGVEIKDIERVCPLTCRAMLQDEVVVQELSHNHYRILTQDDAIISRFNDTSRHAAGVEMTKFLRPPPHGLLSIHLPCRCKLTFKHRRDIVVTPPTLCRELGSRNPVVTVALPISWFNITEGATWSYTLKEEIERSIVYQHYAQILHPNLSLPDLPIPEPNSFHIQLAQWHPVITDYTTTLWNAALTLALL